MFNIIMIVIFLVLWILISILTDNEFKGLFITCVIFLILWITIYSFGSEMIVSCETEEVSVYTLSDNNYKNQNGEMSGSILFVYGKISTENGLAYSTMVGNNENGYLVKQLDASTTYLYMDEEETPYIKYTYEVKEVIVGKVAMFFKMKNSSNREVIRIELHIPKSSVSTSYIIDLN